MTLTIPERVAAGAAWMDENAPGWWKRIDLDDLDLAEPCDCVLGQEWGHFWSAPPLAKYERPVVGDAETAEVAAWAVPLGFDTGDPDAWDVARELTAEWRRVIEARRSGGAS